MPDDGTATAGEASNDTATERAVFDALVGEALRGQLAALSPECGQMLRAAAVLGRQFEMTSPAAVAGVAGEPLLRTVDEAVAAGVLVECDGRHQFAHAIFADVLYGATAAVERLRAVHRLGSAVHGVRHDLSTPCTATGDGKCVCQIR